MVSIDYKDIKNKLSNKISNTGWEFVDRYIYSNEFQKCLEFLVNDVNNNRRFTPKIKYLFRAFELCKHDDLKVVMIGQDPYPTINVADGLAFSCSIKNKEQPSLGKMFDYISKDQPDYNRDTDLSRWAKQGVLLINIALTTTLNRPGTHYNLWHKFITDLLKYINDNHKDIVFVFLGRKAEQFKYFINQHPTFYASHPASANYNKIDWDGKDIFNKTNVKLNKFGKQSIIW